MKIYYGGGLLLPDDFLKVGFLISFYGLKKFKKPVWADSVFLDSGAFSAFHRKDKIDLRSYIEFICKNESSFQIYASLDDLSSYRKSIDNYKTMVRAGLNPLPCFHMNEPLWVLEKYLEGTNYIGLGGMAKVVVRKRREWLDYIFSKYPDPAKVRFHGFGINDTESLIDYPWATVDATSVQTQARYGGIRTKWGWMKINESVKQMNALNWICPMNKKKMEEWIIELSKIYPVKYEQAMETSREGVMNRAAISIIFYEQLSRQGIHLYKNRNRGFGFRG